MVLSTATTMPVIEYNENMLTREDIRRKPQNPWRDCRRISLKDPSLEDVSYEVLGRWLEEVGKYVEAIDAGTFFNSFDRISGFWAMNGTTPCLKELRVQGPAPNAATQNLGDVLLLALTQVPALETLKLYEVQFASSVTVEKFLACSKTLTYLELNTLSVVGPKSTVEAVAQGFCRGIEQCQTLKKMYVAFSSSEKNDGILLRGILLGIMKSGGRIQELALDLYGQLSENTLTALQFFFAGLTGVRKLEFSGSLALVALFRGMASRTTSLEDLSIEAIDYGVNLTFPSTDNDLSRAIREWNRSDTTIKTLSLGGELAFGPKARDALAECIAQVTALESLSVAGNAMPSLDSMFLQMGRLCTVKLDSLESPNWTALNNSILPHRDNRLTEFELKGTSLSVDDIRVLLQFLSRIKCLKTVRMNKCEVGAEAAARFVGLIQQDRLKELDLRLNPLGTQGAKMILEAVSTNAPTMERLLLDSAGMSANVRDFSINDCRDALGGIMDSRLVSLRLISTIRMERGTVELLANGLRRNTTLKLLCVPYLKLEDLCLLAPPLAENRVLEILDFEYDVNLQLIEDNTVPVFVDAEQAEEQSMCDFIDAIPQMMGLKKIVCMFDRKPTKRLTECAIAAMRLNTNLEEVSFVGMEKSPAKYLFGNETVQFYLELNRFHRRQYLASIGSKSLPSSLLPLVLARMTRPEHRSHLFYFLRHGAGLLQSSAAGASSLKRKAVSSHEGTA